MGDFSIEWGKYKSHFTRERMALLTTMLRTRNIANPLGVLTMTVADYEGLCLGNQQLAIPFGVVKHLIQKFSLILEGFASPFNSQFLPVLGDGSYCSLCDGDHVFGSLGDFFDQDITGSRVLINSPFIEDLIDQVVERVAWAIDTGRCAEARDTEILMVVPLWRNAKFYAMLCALVKKFKGHFFALYARTHKFGFENTAMGSVKTYMPATFNIAWFAFGKNAHKLVERDVCEY